MSARESREGILMTCSDAGVPYRATPAKVARSTLASTAPSAARRPAAEGEAVADEGVAAEQVEASFEAGMSAPAITVGEASAVGAAVVAAYG